MNPDQRTGPASPAAAFASARKVLEDYLQGDTASLLGTLRSYVLRMGLASGVEVPEVALEVFQESAAEALAHAERFDQQASPRAWLLGIAVNIIKRRLVLRARGFRREESLGHLVRRYPHLPDENAVLDSLLPPETIGPAQIVESSEQARALLALVSPEDQRILRLAVLEGHQHISLAQELGTTPGTARVRLHRALSRLRLAWTAQQEKQEKGTRNG